MKTVDNEKLENGDSGNSGGEIPTNDADHTGGVTEAQAITRIIQESKANIAEADQVAVKRKRGRPRKNIAQAAVAVATSETNTAEAAPLPPEVEVDHRPGLKFLSGMLGDELAAGTGCERLKFDENEQTAIAENGNVILKRLFPNASDLPPELIAGLALAALAYTKLTIYREWQKAEEKKTQTVAPAAA